MCTCAAARVRHMVQVWRVANGMMACKEEEEEEEEEEANRIARATKMDRRKRMPTRRLSHPGVIQILSLHVPVLNSASDHFLVQQTRIDTISLLPNLPFPPSFFLPISFFCFCLRQIG
jgi:hypothetical protein